MKRRDVVRALAQSGPAALDHAISKHMTAKVATGRESDTLQDLMSQMTLGKFRHVPIVEQGRLIGIVSIGDVVKYRLAEIEAETQAMRDYISA